MHALGKEEALLILIDYKDTRPIYEQIVEKFKVLILSGALEKECKLPSVRSLAVDLSINPNTIQKAYAQLEREGFIYTVKGRGNFVCDNFALLEAKRNELKERLRSLVKEADEVGIKKEELMEFMKEVLYD